VKCTGVCGLDAERRPLIWGSVLRRRDSVSMFGTNPVTAGSTAHKASTLIGSSPALLTCWLGGLFASGLRIIVSHACTRTRQRCDVADGAGTWAWGLGRVHTRNGSGAVMRFAGLGCGKGGQWEWTKAEGTLSAPVRGFLTKTFLNPDVLNDY
jgi:hypothetical protein